MKNIALTLLSVAALFSTGVYAGEKVPYGFLESSADEVASMATSSGLIYSYDMKSSSEWDSQTVNEANLFKGFKSFESWDPVNDSNESIIYASEVAFVIDRSVDQSSLSRLGTADFFSSIDPGFAHIASDVSQANSVYNQAQTEGKESTITHLNSLVKKGQLSEAEKADLIEKSEAQYQVNIATKWCAETDAKCLESTARIPFLYRQVLAGASLAGVDVPESIQVYSELKPLSADELSQAKATAGVVQTGFLSNKTLIGLKSFILATDLGGSKTLITIKTYVMMEKDDLDKFQSLGSYDFVVGNSYLNSDEGITMGLPLYSLRMAESLREKL